MTPTITPKGWENFQHYRDRKPTWIKLHRDLLDNYEYHCLPVASRALAPCLWLLASEYEGGAIPADWNLIAFRLRLTPSDVECAVSALIDKGFFVASNVLATCKQSASLEREREVETEVEKEIPVPNGTGRASPQGEAPEAPQKLAAPKADPIDYQGIVDLYHKILCPPMQRCLILNETRRGHIRQRVRDALPNLAEWEAYFRHIGTSDFLMGRAATTNGRKPFVADLDWIIKAQNFVKIAEGKYHQ